MFRTIRRDCCKVNLWKKIVTELERQVPSHEYLIDFIVSHDLSRVILLSASEQKIFMFAADIIPVPAGLRNLVLFGDICPVVIHRLNNPQLCTAWQTITISI